MTQQLNV